MKVDEPMDEEVRVALTVILVLIVLGVVIVVSYWLGAILRG